MSPELQNSLTVVVYIMSLVWIICSTLFALAAHAKRRTVRVAAMKMQAPSVDYEWVV